MDLGGRLHVRVSFIRGPGKRLCRQLGDSDVITKSCHYTELNPGPATDGQLLQRLRVNIMGYLLASHVWFAA